MEPCEPDKLIEAPAEPSLILEGLSNKLYYFQVSPTSIILQMRDMVSQGNALRASCSHFPTTFCECIRSHSNESEIMPQNFSKQRREPANSPPFGVDARIELRPHR